MTDVAVGDESDSKHTRSGELLTTGPNSQIDTLRQGANKRNSLQKRGPIARRTDKELKPPQIRLGQRNRACARTIQLRDDESVSLECECPGTESLRKTKIHDCFPIPQAFVIGKRCWLPTKNRPKKSAAMVAAGKHHQ